ncbi:hypothetical protein [Acidithiobacillus sp.]
MTENCLFAQVGLSFRGERRNPLIRARSRLGLDATDPDWRVTGQIPV